jgi:TolB-like protein/tetratricopeptide (TPR) repeat protein
MAERSFISELRKRKVVQAAAIYVAVAWGVTEIVVTIVEQLFLQQWVATLAVIFFVVGFPIAMFLSWTFDLTAEGIQRTSVTSRRGTASIALSMALLIAGTTGLFLLIKPALDGGGPRPVQIKIAPNSIAVLPFDYSGPNPDDSYLGPSLSAELRDQLGRVAGLSISATSSSVAAVREGTDAKTMATKLGVEHLLEGSMRRQGNILRVSVQLIDGDSGLAVWNETFERGRRELLSLQQEIAEAVVREMVPGSDSVVAKPTTTVPTAYELILLARNYEQQVREREDVDHDLLGRAIELYREATELDPGSALAHSHLADALMNYGDIDFAEAPAYRALELDPRLAQAQNTWGKFLFARGRPNMGEPLARAVELNPNLPDALHDYAHWHWYNVGPIGVRELYERALSKDRLNVVRYAALGSFLALNGQPGEARDVVKQMIAIFDSAAAYRAIADVLDEIGDVDHSIAWTIKARDAEPNNPLHNEKLAEYYVDIGDYETARDLMPNMGVGLLFKMQRYEEMIDEAEILMIEDPDDVELRVYLSIAYSAVERFDDAIRVISTSGLLDSLPNGWRSPREWEGYWAVMNAAYGSGEIERARDLAKWWQTFRPPDDTSEWWVALGAACTFAIIGDDDEVHRRFQRAQEGRHLAWRPMLEDAQCFERFANDPAFQSTVKHFDDHRAMLRARLPATLAKFGVSLFVSVPGE